MTEQSTDHAVVPLRGIRGLTAKTMTASLQQSAQVTLESDIDATPLVEQRRRLHHEGLPVAYDDLVMRGVALALRDHPRLNGLVVGDEVRVYSTINVAFAIALPEGLVAPAIVNTDTKSFAELVQGRQDLVARAETNQLTVPEMTSGTFTITNLGLYRVDHFTPVINPPQIAILGLGRIAPRPYATDDGRVEARPTLPLSLTFDHRAVDGAPAAAFLQALCALLEEPAGIPDRPSPVQR